MCIYEKKGQTPELARDWLENLLAEEVSESFVTPAVPLGHVFKTHLTFLLLPRVPDSFKVNHEHSHKVDIHSQKSERTLNHDIALQEVSVPRPRPPSPCIPLFVVFHSCLGKCL